MDNYKLSKNEAVLLLIVLMINKLILNIPYYIIKLVGSGTIVNLLYVGIIDFAFLLLLLKLFKYFENQDIIDIAYYVGGKKLKIIVGILSILLFILASYITLLDFSNVLHTIYFSNFDLIYILLFFIIGILIANLSGLKSISSTTSFICFFALASILITFLNTSSNLDITKFTPILGKDLYTTFVKGLVNCFSIYMLVYVYFLKPLLRKPEDFNKISICAFIVSFIILFITTISMLSLFTSNSNSEPINSLFLLARQIEFGNFLQRIDAVLIFIWIFSIFAYLSFCIFMISKILKKLLRIEDEKQLSYLICSILLGLTLIPINIAKLHYIENRLYRLSIIYFVFIIGLLILIFATLKKRKVN